MTLAQIRVLAAVVDSGSFTKAAEALHMTQSAASHAVASLEADLGVTLLIRDRRAGLVLSDFGRLVLEPVRRMLENAALIEAEAVATRGVESGTLRLGSFPSAAARLLPRLLGAFGRRHPGIGIVLFEGSDQEIQEWIDSRAIDVGVVAQGALGADVIPLARDHLVAVVPGGLAERWPGAVPAAELADQPFLMSTGGCEPLIREWFARAGVPPRVRFAVRDMATILNMVREGLGVTIMPELALPGGLPDLAVRALAPAQPRYLGLRTAPGEPLPSVRAFVAMARGLFPVENCGDGGASGPPV